MISNKIELRVRYNETDQMCYVHHGNYAQYFEMGRIEWLRKMGISYKKMEEDGIMLPVINLNVNYIKPAIYDDLLTIKTTISKKPSARIQFEYEIYNEKKELITTGSTILVFVNSETRRPTRAPQYLLNKLDEYGIKFL